MDQGVQSEVNPTQNVNTVTNTPLVDNESTANSSVIAEAGQDGVGDKINSDNLETSSQICDESQTVLSSRMAAEDDDSKGSDEVVVKSSQSMGDSDVGKEVILVSDTGGLNKEGVVPDICIDVDEPVEEDLLIIDESSNEKEEGSINDMKDEDVQLCKFTPIIVRDSSTTETPSNSDVAITPHSNTPKDGNTPLSKSKTPAKRRCTPKSTDGKMSDEMLGLYRVPFKHGWKREVVNRNVVTSGKKSQCDIYYFTPSGKKLRSMVEIETWLSENRGGPVKFTHFTFARKSIYEPPYEIVRDAGKSHRNSNNSQTEATPKLKQKVEKKKENKFSILKKQLLKPTQTGFKAVLSRPVNRHTGGVDPSTSAPDRTENQNSSTVIRPKIKYVPKKPQILTTLLKKPAKRPRPRSPDWLPGVSDSDVSDKEKSPVRNVEVIKYSASGNLSADGTNEGDEIQNVLGTPSKLISSIVNPAPLQMSAPTPVLVAAPATTQVRPLNFDVAPDGTVKVQIVTKKNAKPEEVFAKLGLDTSQFRILSHTGPITSQNITISDSRIILRPAKNQVTASINPRSRMPSLQHRPVSVLPQTQATQHTVLPPPPPLASRPILPIQVIGSSNVKSLLPPLQRVVSTPNPVPILPGPPPLQSPMLRPNHPTQPQPTCNTRPLLHTRITKPTNLTTASSPSGSQTTRSSTPELVDKIFNNLPGFLGMDSSFSPSIPNISTIPYSPTPLVVDYTNTNYHPNIAQDPTHQNSLNKKDRNVHTPSNFPDLVNEEKNDNVVNEELDSDDFSLVDSDNDDSILPISFGKQLKTKNDSEECSNSLNQSQSLSSGSIPLDCVTVSDEMNAVKSPDGDVDAFESTSAYGHAKAPSESDLISNQKEADVPSAPLSRKDFLIFKLLQDNFPAMLNIFGFLSNYDLLRAGRVCRSWHRISMMNCLWQKVVVKSVFEDNWNNAVKFFIKVGVTDLTILEVPNKCKMEDVDVMIKALSRMTQLKRLQFSIVSQHIITRLMETMPHLNHVGAQFIIDSEPITKSFFTWTSLSKEFAMAKAVDAILTNGKSVTEAATLNSVPEEELKHLMLSEPSPLQKKEEDAVILCCMRLSQMGFPITSDLLEARLEEEISKRPQPCQPSPHTQKLFCHKLLHKNIHLLKSKIPYGVSDTMSKKLSSYSLSLLKLYQDFGIRKSNSVLSFIIEKFSVLNPAGNKICNVTAMSVISAANVSLPVMLVFPNVVHYPLSAPNLILVGSKEGLPTPNLVFHYLQAVFAEINTRPLIMFCNGNENLISHQLVSECVNNYVFLHCVPSDISNFVFPGNHGGVLHSVSNNVKYTLLREKDFIDLVCKEMTSPSHNLSKVFAKTGIYPLKPAASFEVYRKAFPNHDSSENSNDCDGDLLEENGLNMENVEDLDPGDDSTTFQDEKMDDKENKKTNNNQRVVATPESAMCHSTLPKNCQSSTVSNSSTSEHEKLFEMKVGKKGQGPFRSSYLSKTGVMSRRGRGRKQVFSLFTKDGQTNVNGNAAHNTLSLSSVVGRGKRTYESIRDVDSKEDDRVPAKKSKVCEDKRLSLLEETINEVIAQSREEAEANEKELHEDDTDESSDSNRSGEKEVLVRPSIKIRRSSHGLVSVLNSDVTSGGQSLQVKGQEMEEDSEVEEEDDDDDGSEKVMEIDEEYDEDANDSDNELEDEEGEEVVCVIDELEGDEVHFHKDNEEEEKMDESVLENKSSEKDEDNESDDEDDDRVVDTLQQEADSELENVTEVVKKMKRKKKKRKHSHRSSKSDSKQESEDDSREKVKKERKKKKKKKKKKRKRQEEKKEEVDVGDILSPQKESVQGTMGSDDKGQNEEDESEKKLQYIRRVSLADHDYGTKFDFDSGTEAVKDEENDVVEEYQTCVGDGNPDTNQAIGIAKEKRLVDDDNEMKPVKVAGPEEICHKDGETSDSDDSSSGSGSSNSDSGSSSRSGSGRSRSVSSSSSSSSSGSDEEEVKDNTVVAVVGNDDGGGDDGVDKEQGEAEQSGSEESSSRGSSASSDSDNEEEGGEPSNNVEEEEEEDDEEEEEDDSKCQLCMLANPPHYKDTIIDWVDCDGNCGRWFHVICITRSQAKVNPKRYVCPSCRCKR